MNKINFRFSLLKARFPDLYQEAENKIAGGVERKDVIADWLNELVCHRRNVPGVVPVEKPQKTVVDDVDVAKSIMDSLLD
jgi:hypothetical protein